MCKYIDKLKEITPNLPNVPSIGYFRTNSGGIINYKFDKGNAIAFNLYNDADIAIAKSLMLKNHEFESHNHGGSYEILIILEGKLELKIGNDVRILEKYDDVKIDMAVPHSGKALADVWFIALTIPKDDGFPE